jgi:LmbE family N-acetylglucosaminyl deacetylase
MARFERWVKEEAMKRRIGLPVLTLVAGCALGIVLERATSGPRPQVALAEAMPAPAQAQPPEDGKLRIIIFGAHPDDAEYRGAGVAMKWAKMGAHVKLVSATNGDIGHWKLAGGPLALLRKHEVTEVDRQLGASTEVLDIHDGEILPTLENRRMITRLIRQWNADIVITNRPNDYHPDHRYTSILVQDSAYMVTVPFFCPDTPALKKNPVFLYAPDRFEKPNPFTADVAVGIDDVMEPTLDALLVMKSQIQEGGANGYEGIYPEDPAGRQRRDEQVRTELAHRYQGYADRYRDTLVKFYGAERARKIRYAQAFEVCEYGRQPSKEELKQMFPF